MTLRGATVLISGGTGFLGSHLVRRVTGLGARVQLLVRTASSLDRVADVQPVPDFTRIELDDAAGLGACVRAVRPDFVFLAAGSTSDRGRDHSGEAAAGRSYEANVIGTRRVLESISAEAPAAKVIRIGSLAEYGVGPLPFREDQREQPASPYAASQVAATHLGQALHRQMGLQVATMRVALTYGPAQSTSFLIPSLIMACLEGRPFDLASASHTRDLIFVDDVMDALVAAALAGGLAGEVVNIGSGREYRIGDVAAMIVRLTGAGIELRPSRTAAVGTEVQRLVCDSERARQLLEWQARTPIEEGLERTIAWYRSSRAS
jgi:nucleoside-diphosphate-sugar epimerase